ncbi:uncharacterized protein PHACADRAFT_214739 [Phanerochaete carnosa HHB-10118-sp]|uniref:Uncharacterized protein n=1 Tax=Phanerochaete carnosa (strain HHB-10118-sp) TaxID=650164 RepID=K5WEI8_PHACS|nr:uncharacterized protein PHACADRAFT_214739 [Phanerochaete carnosa HHB-10118-sp]EKM48592.1 hypothetical protein PHACADRAFT_214739 [Phanerochaete carnosa HHB-10118-sp]
MLEIISLYNAATPPHPVHELVQIYSVRPRSFRFSVRPEAWLPIERPTNGFLLPSDAQHLLDPQRCATCVFSAREPHRMRMGAHLAIDVPIAAFPQLLPSMCVGQRSIS